MSRFSNMNQKIVTHEFEDGGDGRCVHKIGQAYCGYEQRSPFHGYALLPADWNEDSSLETWFPLTAQEMRENKAELAVLRESEKHRKELIDTNAKLKLTLEAALMWLNALEYELGSGEKFVNAMPYKCPTRSQMRDLIK